MATHIVSEKGKKTNEYISVSRIKNIMFEYSSKEFLVVLVREVGEYTRVELV